MQKIHALALTALTLPLMLAACGQSALPSRSVDTASLVKVRVNSLGLARTFGTASLRTQGLPSDGHGGLPAMQMNVTVRDSQNTVVAFNEGTYDPTGQGSRTLTLNAGNGFATSVLLPAGTYSFENATTDAGGADVLLAYGPGTENTQTMDDAHPSVMLKFHAVLNAAQSKLDFATDTTTVYTNDTFNLRLYAKSSAVDGVTYTIPTSDLKLGAPAYTLGSELEGRLNGAGSLLGVNVTATGSADETVLSVTPNVQAWLRTPGTDTASFRDVTLPTFKHQIQVSGLRADVKPPNGVTLVALDAVQTNSAVNLSGTAFDDVAVQSLRLYADQNLIASTDPADVDAGVPSLITDEDGNWSASWTPMSAGRHELTVVATDSSGNESQATQALTAASYTSAALPMNPDSSSYYSTGTANFTLAPHADLWVKIDLSGCGYCLEYNDVYVQINSNQTAGIFTKLPLAVSKSLSGVSVVAKYPPSYGDSYLSGSYSGSSYYYSPTLYAHVKNTTDTAQSFTLFAGSND